LWPAGGEIDIFEGVNRQTKNQMALHTTAGCIQAAGVTQTGNTDQANCDDNRNGGSGCTVIDVNENSYGAPFAAAGGGVWVTEFADTGINIWFFSRPNVPASLSTDTIDVSTFGTPTASWPASSCNTAEHFKEQEIVIDITLCGKWAGKPDILAATCPALTGNNNCYSTYVLDPANYANAYFELASVKVFKVDPSTVTTTFNPSTFTELSVTRTMNVPTYQDGTPTTTMGGSQTTGASGAAQRAASFSSTIVMSVTAGILGLCAFMGMSLGL
jgi:hypothetical protein